MENRNIRRPVIIISAISLLAVIALSILLALYASDAKRKTRMLENEYERSFYLLCDSTNNLETDLGKLTVASADSDSVEIIQDAYNHANSATDGYLGLPIDFENEYEAVKFFNQVEDWASAYIKAVVNGDGAQYKKHAEPLFKTASEINERLKQIAASTEGRKPYERVGEGLVSSEVLDDSSTEPTIKYPSLIYDGPFSDSEEFVAYALENKKEVSADEAQKVAEELLGMQSVKYLGITSGKVAAYEFEGEKNGAYAYASVTKSGGYVFNYMTGVDDDGGSLGEEECGKIGVAMLKKLGFTSMQPVWYNTIQNDIYINFAPVVNDVTYYTDLVKMRISTSGTIEGIEAMGYLSSFRNRTYETEITQEEAISKAENITVKSVGKAVIPKDGGEKFCYEVYGEHNGLDYYIYVDAQNGKQVDVLRVVDSEQGRKAI